MAYRCPGQQVQGGIIVDDLSLNNPAVAMIGILAKADIRDNRQVGNAAFNRLDSLLHDTVFIVGRRSQGIFLFRYAKEHHGRYVQVPGFFCYLYQVVDGELVMTRHGLDGIFYIFTANGKKR